MAEAAAALSALSCPGGHSRATAVTDRTGVRVAVLCLDCWAQLPATWPADETTAPA